MIRSWQIPQHYMSIARYMENEIPVSRIQVNNRLIDAVTVEVIRTDSLGLWIEVGRTQAGYHYSVTYAVPTGGGCGGVPGGCGAFARHDEEQALRAADPRSGLRGPGAGGGGRTDGNHGGQFV